MVTSAGAGSAAEIESFETLAFYRGLSNGDCPTAPVIIRTRKDRKPRDLPLHIHDQADSWFNHRFGIRYRSQAVFVTGSRFIAQNYANSPRHVVRVIPLGAYRYCWSPKNSDLLFYRTKQDTIAVEDYLESSGYAESGLRSACTSGNEVMLFCDSYIAIPVGLLDPSTVDTAKPLILI
jgi:hypothetical protein